MRHVHIIGCGDAAILTACVAKELGYDYSFYGMSPFSEDRFHEVKKYGVRYLHAPKESVLYRRFLDRWLGKGHWGVKWVHCHVFLIGEGKLRLEECLNLPRDQLFKILKDYARKTHRDIEDNLMNGLGGLNPNLRCVGVDNMDPGSVYRKFFREAMAFVGKPKVNPITTRDLQDILASKDPVVFCDPFVKWKFSFELWTGRDLSAVEGLAGYFLIGEVPEWGFDFVYYPDSGVPFHRFSRNGGYFCLEFPDKPDEGLIFKVGASLESYGLGEIFRDGVFKADLQTIQNYHFPNRAMEVASEVRKMLQGRYRNLEFNGRYARVDRSKVEDMILVAERFLGGESAPDTRVS